MMGASRKATLAGRRTPLLVVAGLVLVTAARVAVASFGLETLSEVRAYVGGEGRWSKAQKNAIHDLVRYAATHEEGDYGRYLAALEVPHGDRRARLELDKPTYDLRVVREGFVAGGNSPEDTAGMASLYRRFHSLHHLQKAIGIWSEADAEIAALERTGDRLHRAVSSGSPDPAEVREILAEIERTNVRMTALENDFSDTLGDAARWVTDLLRSVLLGTAIVLVLGVGWIMWRLFENLRRTEDAVRQSEAIYRSLVMDAPVGIGSSRRDGRVRTVNPALVAMLGYANAAELLTKDAVDVYEAPEERVALLARLASGEPVTTETRWRRKDGGVITVRLSGHEVRDAGAADEHISFIVEDVTQTRLLQEQVRQAQKMDAVGLLAGGVAHDFNNMLTVILGAASLLLDELPDGNPAREEAEMIRDVGLRASELTGQLLAFGRKQALAPRVLDLNAVVRETGKLVRPMLGEGVSLELELAPDLPAIHADRGQLEQVVVNLAVNARDAMADGGTLRIETSTVSRRDVPEDAALPAAAVDHARLRMSDTGAGMDAATLGRVFEPFFTTKPRGKGTGLGLATVHGIVHQSGGRICVRSEPGRGATFDVYLPSTTGVAVPRSPQAAPAAASTGDETVLVVDDQDEVMRLTSRILRTQGYSVLEARSGADALRVAAAHAGAVHLLVTDVMMPGLNGRELAAELLRERPGLRVLYLSGYSGGALVNQGVIEPGIAVLSKPFTTEGLARRVRDVLLAAPARAEGTAGVCSRP